MYKRSERTEERARSFALFCLGRKMRTKRELFEKLREKDYPAEICERVSESFEELGYINDEDYAMRYVQDAYNLRKLGEFRIKSELRERGVAAEIVHKVMGELSLDFGKSLAEAVEMKVERTDMNDPKAKDRLINYFVRRGYKVGEIVNVLREMIAD